MEKPELLVTAGTIDEVAALIQAGANAVCIGEDRYGMRLSGSFNLDELGQAIQEAHRQSAKVYVVMNNVIHNDILAELPAYLKHLSLLGADAVVFGDPALMIAARIAEVSIPLHWNPEMTATNYASANYWAAKGATRVVVARELNLEQILEMKLQVGMEVQVQVHGMTNIFHSKRSMVSNYRAHQGKEAPNQRFDLAQGLFLVEEERKDGKFPIFEDANGTHIMSAEDICLLENLHELMEGQIDSFKIEGLQKPLAYNVAVVRAYRQAIDAYSLNPAEYTFDPEWLHEIAQLQPKDRALSFGFFYKEQVY
ncbi:MAG: peptidase U32 family protein [Paenibacillaceae bacterium]